ncbi:hypothetical protein ACEWY4_022443 [Coilia grayii]|uniref:Uncharacterized protein n=1 Tax=Coilia grayii TaxID=363190 RepID=A0ABD1J5Z9_9TELE
MGKLTNMESTTVGREFVEEFHHRSKLLPQQSLCKTGESLDVDAERLDTPVCITGSGIQSGFEDARPGCLVGEAVVAQCEEGTLKQVELQVDRSTDVKELEEYFTALEQDRRNLQQLLLDQKEEHEMEMRALEREREQERLEWEREWREKEEALLSSLRSMIISREKLMKDLRSQPHTLVSTKQLAGSAMSRKQKCSKWWSVRKHQAPPDGATLDANTSIACKGIKAAEADLQKIRKLETKVMEAERKKQRKALAKAQKKAEKEEKRSEKKEGKRKDDKVKDSSVTRCWPRYLLTMGCATHAVDM